MKKVPFFLFFIFQGICISLFSDALGRRNTNSIIHEALLIATGLLCAALCIWVWHRYKPDPKGSKGTMFYKKYPMLTGYIILVAGIIVGVLLDRLYASGL